MFKIFIAYHKQAPFISNDILTPIQAGKALGEDLGFIGDDTGDNISAANKEWCELTVLYWMWKNLTADYYGLFHYRRFLNFKNTHNPYFYDFSANSAAKYGWTEEAIKDACRGCDFIMPAKWGTSQTVYDYYALNYNIEDLNTAISVIKELYPDYTQDIEKVMGDKDAYYCNIFIMSKPQFHKYAEWLFDVLFETEKRIEINKDDPYKRRVIGYLGERLINVFVAHALRTNQDLKLKELPLAHHYSIAPLWKRALSKYPNAYRLVRKTFHFIRGLRHKL